MATVFEVEDLCDEWLSIIRSMQWSWCSDEPRLRERHIIRAVSQRSNTSLFEHILVFWKK